MFDITGTTITLTAGDTGLFGAAPEADGYRPTAADRAVFTVRERPGGRKLLEKVLVPEADGAVLVPLLHEDTERLRAGAYVWDIRYVLNAQTDAQGGVTGGREVITPFTPGTMTVMEAIGSV